MEASALGGWEAPRLRGLQARGLYGYLGCSWDALGCSLGVPWELLGDPWELSRAHWSFWVLLGCSLGTLLCSLGALGCFLGALGASWGAPWVDMGRSKPPGKHIYCGLGSTWGRNVAKMLLWLRNGLFFSKNVAVACVLEGYPSSSLATGLSEASLLISVMLFEGFRSHPGLRQ